MQPDVLADSATDAAWAGVYVQGVGAIATFAAVVVALWLSYQDRKYRDSERRDQRAERRAQLAAEVMAAVMELQTAIEGIRIRSTNGTIRWAMPLAAVADVFPDGRPKAHRFANALYRAIDWQQGREDHAHATIVGPMARLSTALAQISLSGSEELRLSADRIREAVGEVMISFGDPKKRKFSTGLLDNAVRDFRAVTVKVTGAAKH